MRSEQREREKTNFKLKFTALMMYRVRERKCIGIRKKEKRTAMKIKGKRKEKVIIL